VNRSFLLGLFAVIHISLEKKPMESPKALFSFVFGLGGKTDKFSP